MGKDTVWYHPEQNRIAIHFLGCLLWFRNGQRLFDKDSVVIGRPELLGWIKIGTM
jgi:hypothetical protein